MKKSLLMGIAALLSLAFGGMANAQSSVQLMTYDVFSGNNDVLNQRSYAKLLNEYDNSWGYSAYDTISGEMKDGALSLESIVVVDSDVYPVPLYRLIMSPYRVKSLKDNDPDLDLSQVIMKDVEAEEHASSVVFSLSSEDNIDVTRGYYGFIVPINDFDVIGTPSRELCFQLASGIYEWDEGCDAFELVLNPAPVEEVQPVEEVIPVEIIPTELGEEHGAASCAGMDLANISHTVNGNEITLTWTAVDGELVQVAIFDPEQEVFRSVGTANMKDEKFVYKMQWDGEQNFMITNGCKEVYYKADAKQTPKKEEPTIVPAATGPAENVLYILIATVVLYGAYALFRKSEDR